MSSIDNIINKLKQDGKDQVDEIIKNYSDQAKAEKEDLIGAARRRRDDILERANVRAQNAYERISSNTELKIRDQRIIEEQKLIDRVFKLAADKLNSKTNDEFLEDIKKVLGKVTEEEISILVPESRLDFMKKSDLGKMIDKENVDYGFVIRTPKFDYNFQYDVLVDQYREIAGAEVLKSVLRK